MPTVDLNTPEARAFVTNPHLATLTTLRPDGTPHVVPVGFSWDGKLARVITSANSIKVANVRHTTRAVLCQVDGGTWVSIEGGARVSDDPDDVAAAVRLYAERYREPRPSSSRVVLLLEPDHVLGRVPDPADQGTG